MHTVQNKRIVCWQNHTIPKSWFPKTAQFTPIAFSTGTICFPLVAVLTKHKCRLLCDGIKQLNIVAKIKWHNLLGLCKLCTWLYKNGYQIRLDLLIEGLNISPLNRMSGCFSDFFFTAEANLAAPVPVYQRVVSWTFRSWNTASLFIIISNSA